MGDDEEVESVLNIFDSIDHVIKNSVSDSVLDMNLIVQDNKIAPDDTEILVSLTSDIIYNIKKIDLVEAILKAQTIGGVEVFINEDKEVIESKLKTDDAKVKYLMDIKLKKNG